MVYSNVNILPDRLATPDVSPFGRAKRKPLQKQEITIAAARLDTVPARASTPAAEPEAVTPPTVPLRLTSPAARRAAAIDLRRRDTRELAEVIVSRAEFLLPDDRELVRAVFADGLNAERVASLRGESSRSVRRRVRLLAKRVLSREYEFVMRRRDAWPRARRLVATACVLQGRTLREAASHLRLSLHSVRRQMDLVNALLDAEQAR